MTMSSFLINSNYIEPKFPPFEEYAQHSGPGGGDGGPGGGPSYPQPPAPAARHLPPPQPPLPRAGGGREPPASYYAPRAAREPSYPAAALYPASGAADAAYPYGYGAGASPGRPEQPPAHAKGPAHGLHASHGPPPGRQPPPPPPASARRSEAAPAAPGVPTGGSAPACPLLLADESPPGLKGREPVVYPWMKKIHVSAGTWRRRGGAGRAGWSPAAGARGSGRGPEARPREGAREGSPGGPAALGWAGARPRPVPARTLLYPGSPYGEIYETPLRWGRNYRPINLTAWQRLRAMCL